MDYTSGYKFFSLSETGSNRLAVQNGGNVGIGTSQPAAKLDVNGNANIEANLTVNAGKEIMLNSQATGQLKYYTLEQGLPPYLLLWLAI